MTESLDDIGRRHGSDKSSLVHGYLADFETYVLSGRPKPQVILEFCWSNDLSLRVWRDWAPDATIVAVFPIPLEGSPPIPGVIYEIGRQNDPDLIARLISLYRPDVVVDDAGHLSSEQISTLSDLFPLLPKGAAYVIEDMHTSFGTLRSRYLGGAKQSTGEHLMRLQMALLGGDSDDLSQADQRILDHLAFIATHRKFAVLYRNEVSPKGLYAIRPVVAAAGEILHEHPAEVYQRGELRILDAEPHLLAAVNRNMGDVTCPVAFVSALPNARVLMEGLVLDREGGVVSESLINRDHAQAFGPFHRLGRKALISSTLSKPKQVHADAAPCALLSQTWDNNYGHWLVESLPRIALLQEKFDITKLNYLIFNRGGAIRKVYIRSLEALGIPESNIIWYDGDIEIANLIYATPLTVQPWIKSSLCVEVLERVRQGMLASWQDVEPASSRIYLSRNKDSRDRLLVNEDELISIAVAAGYEVVHAGLLSFDEQVRIFSGATHVCGNLGAGFTNIAFSPKGVSLLGLTAQHMVDDFFYDLCAFKGGKYWSLHGRGVGVRSGYRDDFRIEPQRFEAILQEFHA